MMKGKKERKEEKANIVRGTSAVNLSDPSVHVLGALLLMALMFQRLQRSEVTEIRSSLRHRDRENRVFC